MEICTHYIPLLKTHRNLDIVELFVRFVSWDANIIDISLVPTDVLKIDYENDTMKDQEFSLCLNIVRALKADYFYEQYYKNKGFLTLVKICEFEFDEDKWFAYTRKYIK